MSGKITIFNYEAFYLDFLEGNLDEIDLQLFEEFLRKHPELREHDTTLPVLDDDKLTFKNKGSLKEYSENDAISKENVEVALIAKQEGVLAESKRSELAQFISKNPEYETDELLYNKVNLTPDLNDVYTGPSLIEGKKPVVLWPYVSGVAAASIVAFFFLFGPSQGVIPNGLAPTVAETYDEITVEPSSNPKLIGSSTLNESMTQENPVSNGRERLIKNKVEDNNPVTFEIDAPLEKRSLRPILANMSYSLQPITALNYPVENEVVEEIVADNRMASFDDMRNPIEPITKLLSSKTKTDIDFRSRKKSNEKHGGFFVKIGKFSFSRSNH